jgi:3-oxoacyl-[acyl-carrier protein] reductase
MAKKAEIERLFSETKKAFGRLDILVNNAGVYELLPLEKITEEHFHRHFDINVLGLLLAIQEATNYFGPEGGSVINISSSASSSGQPLHLSTVLPRQLWTQLPNRSPRSLDHAKSASTLLTPE